MIRVLGGPKRLCDGLTRRDLLHIGSAGLLGLNLPWWHSGPRVRADETARAGLPGFGKAKTCILLFLYGSPSQLETFDPKPDAPREIQGELGSIASSVSGLSVCDRLPLLAQVMDKVTVLRSVSHPYPIHGVAFATTGNPRIDIPMELSPRNPNHWPFIGSVVDYVDRAHRIEEKATAMAAATTNGGCKGGRESALPANILLPWAFSSRRVGEVPRAGPYGGFLGPAYDPVCAEFVGKGTRCVRKTLLEQTWENFEPYRGIARESRFQLSSVTHLNAELTLDRLDRRRSLLEQFEHARRAVDSTTARMPIDRQRAMAFDLIGSARIRDAFDLDLEADETRGLYGMTLFGQAALLARRLTEAGGRFITVFWDEYGLAGSGWDTHWDHFPRMKDELLPGLDQTLSGLLIDLDRRGLLDETLVVLLSEHGRTPKIGSVAGGGRDHWSRCYSVVMAGGGVARGRVVGRSDKIAGDPIDRPVSPKDILATMYHLLGIDPGTTIIDNLDRPMTLVPGGEVIPEVLG
jgi:hypothetical protein